MLAGFWAYAEDDTGKADIDKLKGESGADFIATTLEAAVGHFTREVAVTGSNASTEIEMPDDRQAARASGPGSTAGPT